VRLLFLEPPAATSPVPPRGRLNNSPSGSGGLNLPRNEIAAAVISFQRGVYASAGPVPFDLSGEGRQTKGATTWRQKNHAWRRDSNIPAGVP
jgi:hypothetical protein